MPDKWILSRLVGKHYDRVEFKNGYGRGVPTMEVEYLGWGYSFGKRQWGGGAEQGSPYATIYLGRILNIDMCPKIESQGAPDSHPSGCTPARLAPPHQRLENASKHSERLPPWEMGESL